MHKAVMFLFWSVLLGGVAPLVVSTPFIPSAELQWVGGAFGLSFAVGLLLSIVWRSKRGLIQPGQLTPLKCLTAILGLVSLIPWFGYMAISVSLGSVLNSRFATPGTEVVIVEDWHNASRGRRGHCAHADFVGIHPLLVSPGAFCMSDGIHPEAGTSVVLVGRKSALGMSIDSYRWHQ